MRSIIRNSAESIPERGFDLNTEEQVNARFGEYNAARLARRIVMGLKISF
jgi:hypothetical protein